MAIIKKDYELIIWDEKLDFKDNIDIKTEIRNYTIGSNTMTYPGRATNVELKRELKGTNTLTFDMPTKFFNSKTGKFEKNEFIDDLFNERKLKLHYDSKWYEFYIKKIDEKKQYKSIMKSFECTDSFIEELSRTGYDIEFSEDKYNSVQEAGDFMNEILEDSVWDYKPEYNTGDFTEYNEEMFYKIPLSQFGGKLFGYEIKLDVKESDFQFTSAYYRKVEERDGEGSFNRELESKINDLYTGHNRQLQYGDDLSREKELFFDPYEEPDNPYTSEKQDDNGHDLISLDRTEIKGDYIYVPMSDLSMVMGAVYKQTREAQETPGLYGAYEDKGKDWYQHYALCPTSKNPKDFIQFIWFADKDEVKIDEGNVICNMDHHYLIHIEDWDRCLSEAHTADNKCNSQNIYWTATKAQEGTTTLYYTYGEEADQGIDGDTVYTKNITTSSLVNDDFDWNPVYYENYLTNIGSTEATQARKISITDRTELDMGKIEKEDWEGNKDEDDKTYATIYKTPSSDFNDYEYTEPELTGGIKAPKGYYDDIDSDKKETDAEFAVRDSTGKNALKENKKQYRVMSKIATREIVPKLATNIVQNGERITSTSGWEVRQMKDPDDEDGTNTASSYQIMTVEAQNVLQDEYTEQYSESGKLTEDTETYTKTTIKEQNNTVGTSIDEKVYDYYLSIDSPYYDKLDNFDKEGLVCYDYLLNFGLSSQDKKIEKDKVYALQFITGRDYTYTYEIKFRNATSSDDATSWWTMYPPLPDTYAGLEEDEIAEIEEDTSKEHYELYKGKSKKWRENYVNLVVEDYKKTIDRYFEIFRRWGTPEGYTYYENLLEEYRTFSVYDFWISDGKLSKAIKSRAGTLGLSNNHTTVGNINFDNFKDYVYTDDVSGNDFATLSDVLLSNEEVYNKIKTENSTVTFPEVTAANIGSPTATYSGTIYKPTKFISGKYVNAAAKQITGLRYCPCAVKDDTTGLYIVMNIYPYATMTLKNSEGNAGPSSSNYQILLTDAQIKKYVSEVLIPSDNKKDTDEETKTALLTADMQDNTVDLSGDGNVSISVKNLICAILTEDEAKKGEYSYSAEVEKNTGINVSSIAKNEYVPTMFEFDLSSYPGLAKELEKMEYYGKYGRYEFTQQKFYTQDGWNSTNVLNKIKSEVSNEICSILWNDENYNRYKDRFYSDATKNVKDYLNWNMDKDIVDDISAGTTDQKKLAITPNYYVYNYIDTQFENDANKKTEFEKNAITGCFEVMTSVAQIYNYVGSASTKDENKDEENKDTKDDDKKDTDTKDKKDDTTVLSAGQDDTDNTDKDDAIDTDNTKTTNPLSTQEVYYYGGTESISDMKYFLYYVKQLDMQDGHPEIDWTGIEVAAPNKKEEQKIIDECIVPKTRFKKKYNIDLDHIIIGEGSINSEGNYTIQGAIDNLNNDPDRFITFKNLFEQVDTPTNSLYFVPKELKIQDDEIISGASILGIDGETLPTTNQKGYLTHPLYRTRKPDPDETLTSYYKNKNNNEWYWRKRMKPGQASNQPGCEKIGDTYISIEDNAFLLFKAKKTIEKPYIGIYIASKPIEINIDTVTKNVFGYSQKGIKLELVTPLVDYRNDKEYKGASLTEGAYYGVDGASVVLYPISTDNGFSEDYCNSIFYNKDNMNIDADDDKIKAALSTPENDRCFGELKDSDFQVANATISYTYTTDTSKDVLINNFEISRDEDKSRPYAIFIKDTDSSSIGGIYMGVIWLQRK